MYDVERFCEYCGEMPQRLVRQRERRIEGRGEEKREARRCRWAVSLFSAGARNKFNAEGGGGKGVQGRFDKHRTCVVEVLSNYRSYRRYESRSAAGPFAHYTVLRTGDGCIYCVPGCGTIDNE